MKNNILKYFTRPLSFLLIAVLLFASVLSVTASAEDTETGYREFKLTPSGNTLYDDSGSYKLRTLPLGYYLNDRDGYVYYNRVEYEDNYLAVCTAYVGSDIYWVDGYPSDTVFMSEERIDELRPFFNGEITGRYTIHENGFYGKYAEINKTLADSLYVYTEKMTLDVRDLYDLPYYVVYAYDNPTGTIARAEGAVFILDKGTHVYVDYTTLDNSHFDANGELSFRQGTVSASVLLGSAVMGVDSAIEKMRYPTYNYVYEGEDIQYGTGTPLFLFWIMILFIGIIAPIAPIVFGIAYPIYMDKKRKPRLSTMQKRDTPPTKAQEEAPAAPPRHRFSVWHTVSIAGAVWLILGVAMLLVLIFG